MKEKRRGMFSKKVSDLAKCWQLWVMMLPAILYIVLFAYKPMYGILIAFKNYSFRKGIWGSEWIGFSNFTRLFESYWFPVIMKNTLQLSILSLLIGFPIPIILALLFSEVKNEKFRTTVQTVSYAPHFISLVVMCGMLILFLSPTTGVLNKLLNYLGFESVYFMQDASMFKWIYVWSDVWQGAGWGSIIYFAALSGVDDALLEAAELDGASRLQKIWHVKIPAILPTIVVTFILRCGSLLSVGYEKAYLLQTSTNLAGSEIISTYVYKVGLEQADFGFSTAINLLNTIVNCIILILANQLSKKVTDSGLM